MPQDMPQMKASGPSGKSGPGAKSALLQEWILIWAQRLWRPVGTAVAVVLALLVTWHVIYGTHGVSVWQQKRAEDRALQQEIKSLQEENEQMRQQVQRLQSDPEAIEREAREKLHYAKQGEVIVSMPAQSQGQQQQFK
jgi:cell division protein FtsB